MADYKQLCVRSISKEDTSFFQHANLYIHSEPFYVRIDYKHDKFRIRGGNDVFIVALETYSQVLEFIYINIRDLPVNTNMSIQIMKPTTFEDDTVHTYTHKAIDNLESHRDIALVKDWNNYKTYISKVLISLIQAEISA